MKVLVIAEHDNHALKTATHCCVSAAAQLMESVDILVAGRECENVAKQAGELKFVSQVLLADNACYEHQLAENMSALISELAPQYTHVLAPATSFGKNIMPRVAARLDVMQISDILAIEDHNIFVRPIYAGNALATVQSEDAVKIITVRTSAFDAVESANNNASIIAIDSVHAFSKIKFTRRELTKNNRPELTDARIVISGGRGMQSAENFQLLEQLADRLGAAIGASRAAVDAGFVPNDYQIGQTGKVIAPELYIAFGISGAIQHIAGIKDSKIIVAINKDPKAPIFEIADYGVVGDLFEILPELIKQLEA